MGKRQVSTNFQLFGTSRIAHFPILFEKITKSNDYYPTKKEMEILDKKNKKIKKELPAGSSIIEFGAGSNKKIKKLLEILDSPSEYISIDISKEFLLENSKKLVSVPIYRKTL